MLISVSSQKAAKKHQFAGIDVSEFGAVNKKDEELISITVHHLKQSNQEKNPDHIITFRDFSSQEKLEKYFDSIKGSDTGDDPQYTFLFWEMSEIFYPKFIYFQGTPDSNDDYTGENKNITLGE